MSTLDLSTYSDIYSAYFVKVDIPDYSILRFSTHYKTLSLVESDNIAYSYTNLGDLVSISDSTATIRVNPEQITVTISGIPSFSISVITEQAIKGSKIEVRKIYMNGSNYQIIGTPIIKFKGIVENYNIAEDYPEQPGGTATSSIGLVCSTLFDMYQNKKAGRRTNPLDMKSYYPTDLSMDRVPTVTGANYNFGAPK
jgi:hypothetical protein